MAKLKLRKTGKEIQIKNGNYIRKGAEKLGVNFCCNIGRCGICQINIIKGENNLSELTIEEKEIGMTKKRRLACQCRIKEGEVEIDY